MDLELYTRVISGGRMISVIPLVLGRARLHIGPAWAPFYDDGW